MTITDILHIIRGEFSYQKKSVLDILVKINKHLEVGLYYTFLPLCLAINLWIKNNE